MAENKRSRSSNFTNDEKLNILSIIKKYRHIIENKESGVQSWKTKEDAWKAIEKEFNFASSTFRSVDVLKRFYNNKKKATRKYAANLRFEMNKTGGGEAVKVKDDPVYNLTMDIINKKTVFGLQNKFDNDGNASCSSDIPNTEETVKVQKMHEIEEEDDGIGEENEIIMLEMEDEETPLEKDAMPDTHENTTYTRQTLKTPTLKKLKNSVSNNGWHTRRRPQLTKTGNIALRYEEVADIKKEVMQSQLKILQLQQAELERKNEWERKQMQLREIREKEEFELRKKALELDVKIKEAQLIALHAVNQTNQVHLS